MTGGLNGTHVLLPLLDPDSAVVADQVRVGTALARATTATLTLMGPRDSRTVTDLSRSSGTIERLLDWALDTVNPTTHRRFRYSRGLARGLGRAVEAQDIDTLVLPSNPYGSLLRRGFTERVATHAACDVVVVNGRSGYQSANSILLPIAGGPHSGLAADIAGRIATDCDAWVDVFHVIEGGNTRTRERADSYMEAARRRIDRPTKTTTWTVSAEEAGPVVAEQSRYYDLTVLGAPTRGPFRQLIYGSTTRSVRANAGNVVLSVRDAETSSFLGG